MHTASNTSSVAATPLTKVKAPVVLEPAMLRANPAKITAERNSRTLWNTLGGAALGALMGLNLRNKELMLATTVLGGGIGLATAIFGKTHEEAYSEILTEASHTDDFVGHVKQEMGRRETNAFVNGALIGFWPFF